MREETLDPDNWEELRQLEHQMVDDMLDWLQTLRERPVWQPVPDEVKAHFQQSLPLEAQNLREVYQDFLTDVLPFPNGNQHPRFWGWVHGTGTPSGMLADMLAAGMNPQVGFGEQSAVYVEKQVIDWCKEMLGFPAEASGILVSGCTMANLTGLIVARNAKAGFNDQQQGLQNSNSKMVLYGSSETHSSIQKAIEVLGLGNESFRRIPVNGDYQIDLAALRTAIAEDRAKGLKPFCVIGNAGTVNTGAIDDLAGLADVCAAEDLWFHIDGAFGALAALSPQYRPMVTAPRRERRGFYGFAPMQYRPIAKNYRIWFLYFSVLTFTFRTSLNNALARVSKSRVGLRARSNFSFQALAQSYWGDNMGNSKLEQEPRASSPRERWGLRATDC
jgi:hypothetical protein